jgi:DNA polymerase III epsilon subunit-like protein
MTKLAFKDYRLLFLDFETGGLSASTSDPVEIAAVLTDPSGRTVLDEYCAKVIPTRPVDPKAAAVNGYSAEKWAAENAVPFEHALVRVLGMARDALLTCHNTPFDKAFLEAGIAKHNMRWPSTYHSNDTMALAAPLRNLGLVENVRLETLAAYFGIEHADAHTALSDARACREVYLRLMTIYTPAVEAYAATRATLKPQAEVSASKQLPIESLPETT